MTLTDKAFRRSTVFLLGAMALTGCTSTEMAAKGPSVKDARVAKALPTKEQGKPKEVFSYNSSDRDCLKRAMYFESNRSSYQGFMAVGTVIMNRLTSGIYPKTICGVVTQEKQFAPGVATRKMNEATAPELETAADAILVKGQRSPEVQEAMYFHTDGLRFPYKNMHYTAVAGGNKFYEKRDEDGELQTPAPMPATAYVLSFVDDHANEPFTPIMPRPQDIATTPILTASADDGASSEMMALVAPIPTPRPQYATGGYSAQASAQSNQTAYASRPQTIMSPRPTADWTMRPIED